MHERITLIEGDITKLQVDAIVNAANSTLLGGGGVDGAIHRAAGPKLLEECRKLGGCATGDARITQGYNLPARHVIHTVGPVYHSGREGEPESLADCYRKCMQLAAANDIKHVAFPSISTGAYRFPIGKACPIALKTTVACLNEHGTIAQVTFALFSRADYDVYRVELARALAKG